MSRRKSILHRPNTDSSAIKYGSQSDPRGGGIMATADVFERQAIRDAQISMHRNALSEQAFLNPWRECFSLFRGDTMMEGKPKVSTQTRRLDIPAPVMWLRYDDDPQTEQSKPKVDNGPIPGGASHPSLGILAMNSYKRAGQGSKFFDKLTAGQSEEQKRLFLLSRERHRRHCEIKQRPTDTLAVGAPLPHTDYKGGYIPTGPRYRSGEPNPWPKLAVDSPYRADPSATFNPWTTTRWGSYTPSARPVTTDGTRQDAIEQLNARGDSSIGYD